MTKKMCTTNTVCGRIKASWLYYTNEVGTPCFEELRDKFNKQKFAPCCDGCRNEILKRYNVIVEHVPQRVKSIRTKV